MAGSATWWAPGRVNLIGDHTDYTEGYVLPLAIAAGTTVSLTLSRSGRLRARSSLVPADTVDIPIVGSPDRSFTGLLNGPDAAAPRWAGYIAGAVEVARRDGLAVAGLDVAIRSDLPAGAGLASSAALVCATLGALGDAAARPWDRTWIVQAARQVENEFLGAPVGVMDPTVVMYARDGQALLLDARSLHRQHVPLPLTTLDRGEQGCRLLVVDTHEEHSTGGSGYSDRVRQCERAATLLRLPTLRDATPEDVAGIADPQLRARARHVVTENRRVLEAVTLLRGGRLTDVGPLLTESHRSLRDDFEVSTALLDLVVDRSLDAGALGARLTGAGFGGSAVVLTAATRLAAVRAAVRSACLGAGAREPAIREVTAGDAARRVPASTIS